MKQKEIQSEEVMGESAVCYSVLQCVAVCCSVLQCVTEIQSEEAMGESDYGVATISRLLKILGLFCRDHLFYRALLQKRPIISRSLLIRQ